MTVWSGSAHLFRGFRASRTDRDPVTVRNDIDDAVQARMRRQDVLYRPEKRFHFVLTEAALRHRLCSPEIMLGHLDRLVSMTAMPNVKLGVIGFDTAYVVDPAHGFWMLDENWVMVETFSAELNLAQPELARPATSENSHVIRPVPLLSPDRINRLRDPRPRGGRVPQERLEPLIREVHAESSQTYGAPRGYAELTLGRGITTTREALRNPWADGHDNSWEVGGCEGARRASAAEDRFRSARAQADPGAAAASALLASHRAVSSMPGAPAA